MTTVEWLMVFAVLIAPLIAVQVQKYIERLREKRQRQAEVFHTLMATRTPAARVSLAHVQALNRIDIEFYGRRFFRRAVPTRREKKVVECWKVYLDHLNTKSPGEELRNWAERGDELFLDLLYTMAEALDYHFDKVHLKREVYSPKAHGDEELYQRFMKTVLADTLSGRKPLRVELVEPHALRDAQENEAKS